MAPARHRVEVGAAKLRFGIGRAQRHSPVRAEQTMMHIFVVGLDDFHLKQLKTLPDADRLVFHPLFSRAELKQGDGFPVAALLDEGVRRLRQSPEPVHAVVGYWDFPVSTVLPILRRELGLPGPSLEAVLRCEHKYWSRLCQKDAVPEHVPEFCCIDPFRDDPAKQLTLDYPFWLKPVKAVLSELGFRVRGEEELMSAIAKIRQDIGRYAEPFNLILARADLPASIAGIDGHRCIAEDIISAGRQCTQEGYVFDGETTVYGVVDSLRSGPAGSSFSRYQYPSKLPEPVLERMAAISARLMRHIGYDTGPFNIEYFWDEGSDRIWLLEINPRISKSHAPLFRLVDGQFHHRVMVDLGLGRRPRFTTGQGEYALAAKFMLRRYADARVTRVPDDDEIAAVEAAVPGTQVLIDVQAGMRLSQLRNQDSYSYEVATIFIGAADRAELQAKYRACLARLPLRFEKTAA